MYLLFLNALVTTAALRVCADPNNLPFSNDRGQGFENRIAELIARESRAKLEYTWWPQRRSFLRNTLNAGKCDVVIGYAEGTERALTTKPYYTSSYVIVSAPDLKPPVRSLDDPRLSRLRIGAHTAAEDFVPPIHALARRGILNVQAFSLYNPQSLFESMNAGQLDIAITWGPFAGYYAPKNAITHPVEPQYDGPVPFSFGISVAVRKRDTALRDQIQAILDHNRAKIDSILRSYHVPRPHR
jgi:mxaJ protein